MNFELEEFQLRRDTGEEKPLMIRGEARIPQDAKGTVVICHGFKGFAHFSFFPYLAEQLAMNGFKARPGSVTTARARRSMGEGAEGVAGECVTFPSCTSKA